MLAFETLSKCHLVTKGYCSRSQEVMSSCIALAQEHRLFVWLVIGLTNYNTIPYGTFSMLVSCGRT